MSLGSTMKLLRGLECNQDSFRLLSTVVTKPATAWCPTLAVQARCKLLWWHHTVGNELVVAMEPFTCCVLLTQASNLEYAASSKAVALHKLMECSTRSRLACQRAAVG